MGTEGIRTGTGKNWICFGSKSGINVLFDPNVIFSERFSDPSQMFGLIRFTYPEWYMVKHNTFNSTGLTPEKIQHAVVTAVKNWYMLKQHVNPDFIKSYPDVTK